MKSTTIAKCLSILSVCGSYAHIVGKTDIKEQFKNPPFEYRVLHCGYHR